MKQLLIFLFICISAGVSAQAKKIWLYSADAYFGKEDYPTALLHYKLALNDSLALITHVLPYEVAISGKKLSDLETTGDTTRKVPAVDYINHQIALCYQRTQDYKHAVEHFKLTAATGSYPDDYYYLGLAQMNVERYQDAILSFEQFITSGGDNDSLVKRALVSMTGATHALDTSYLRSRIVVRKADNVLNSGTASFAPMFFDNESRMLFTSARSGGVVDDPENQQSEYLCDIYWTRKTDNGSWEPAVNFAQPLNTSQHEASGSFNNNNALFFTRWSDEKRTEQHIYLSRMVDNLFFESYRLDSSVNFPGYKSINPFVSMDGTTLFFSSNRPGGKGGMDLWKISIDELGNLNGTAVNLGEPVNSEADETTPFLHEASSILFFSSNGHNSIGGLDIFKSIYNRDNETYETPDNMGIPVNSGKDDSYMVWDRYMKKGYFSSDREDCPTSHCYDIYEVENLPVTIILDGYVFDATTEKAIPQATLTFKDIRGEFASFTTKTDDKGFYSIEVRQYWELFIKAQKPAYFADATNIDARRITEDTHLTRDFHLASIPPEEIEIKGIEYDYNSAELRPESMVVLDDLYNFLVLNNNLIVEISSHTDRIGTDVYNLDLSQRRAKLCVDYLVSKGISRDRLFPIGYGESEPAYLLDANNEPVLDANGNKIRLTEEYILTHPTWELQEQCDQRNRRTSFRVINEEFLGSQSF